MRLERFIAIQFATVARPWGGGRAGPLPRPSEPRGMMNSQRPAPAGAVECIITPYGKPKRKFRLQRLLVLGAADGGGVAAGTARGDEEMPAGLGHHVAGNAGDEGGRTQGTVLSVLEKVAEKLAKGESGDSVLG